MKHHNMDDILKVFGAVASQSIDQQYKIAREIIFSTYTYMVYISPVDTGRYRASHEINIGSLNTSGKTLITPKCTLHNAATSITKAKSVVDQIKKGWGNQKKFTVYISNSVAYAWKLEMGHSKQAPKGIYVLGRERAIKLWRQAVGYRG